VIIKWNLDTGVVGCDRSDEIEMEDDATDDEIEAAVREEVFNYIEWGWEKVPT
jgi:hypothetical protein